MQKPVPMKLRYVDALRGLAIMGVLVVHCGQHGMNDYLPAGMTTVLQHGAHGVQLFYVVSAFTLFLTLDKRGIEENTAWLDFYGRRFFRIAPMYYLGICYYLWQDGFGPRYWLGDAETVTAENVVSNFFFIHGFNPYWITSVVPGGWSIAVEMMFYCMIPLLFLRIRNSQQAVVFFLITLALRAVLQFLLNRVHLIESERLWQDYLNLYLPSQLPAFALGILFYFILKEDYKISWSPLILLLLSLIVIAHFAGIPLLPNHVMSSIGFVVMAIALSRFEFKMIVNPILVYIGKISYSMYLVHFAVLFWLSKYAAVDYIAVSGPIDAIANYGIRLLVVLILSVIIASFFYHMIELPFQRIGKRLMNRVRTSGPAVSVEAGHLERLSVLPTTSVAGVLGKTAIDDTASDTSLALKDEK